MPATSELTVTFSIFFGGRTSRHSGLNPPGLALTKVIPRIVRKLCLFNDPGVAAQCFRCLPRGAARGANVAHFIPAPILAPPRPSCHGASCSSRRPTEPLKHSGRHA